MDGTSVGVRVVVLVVLRLVDQPTEVPRRPLKTLTKIAHGRTLVLRP